MNNLHVYAYADLCVYVHADLVRNTLVHVSFI